MATQAGTLLTAIGAKLATDFPTYTIRYGSPDSSGVYTESGNFIYVRYTEEMEEAQGNQLGGVTTVKPRVMVHLERPYTGDSTDDAPHLALLELAADLRLSVNDLIMDNMTGSPISGWPAGAALWITDCTTTPATLDIGSGQSTETVTLQFGFRFTRTFGGR
jgi:hypothetical protein